MSENNRLLEKLIVVKVTIDPDNELIQEQIPAPDEFLSDLLNKIVTPDKHTFTDEPLDHLKVYGYQVKANVLNNADTKVLKLLSDIEKNI